VYWKITPAYYQFLQLQNFLLYQKKFVLQAFIGGPMGSLVKDRKEAPGDSKEGEESARGPERTITGPPFIVVTARTIVIA